MINIETESGTRNEGCRAVLFDDGNTQEIPVRMGGIAIVGCNNPDVCVGLRSERHEDKTSVGVIFRNDDGSRVTGMTTVPREPLVPPGKY